MNETHISEQNNQIDLLDKLFDVDLEFGGIVIKDFSPKKEFELQGLFSKISKRVTENTSLDYEVLMENVGYDQCLRISKWMEDNTNINSELVNGGDIMSKTIIFINIYFDYVEYKKKLKK